MSVNQAERAYKAWTVLTDSAQRGKTITYGELGSALGIHHRTVRYVLGLIQDHCMLKGLPPLTILIVNQKGLPGSGFIAFDIDNFDEGKRLVCTFNWNGIENPFQFAADGKRYEDVIADLANRPDTAKDVMRLVKSRGMAQVMFRDALLNCYEHMCAFTDISFTETLEACHIIPWSLCKQEQKLDVRNGLLLNSLHHKLFDSGWVTVTTDHRIWFSDPNMDAEPYSEYDRLVSVNLHKKKIRLPKNSSLSPSPIFLAECHKIHEWEDFSE